MNSIVQEYNPALNNTKMDILSQERQIHSDWVFNMFENENVRYIRDCAVPGTGKTHTLGDLMYFNYKKCGFVYCIPYFEVLKGNDTILSNLANEWHVDISRHVQIIRGKQEKSYKPDKPCMRPEGQEYCPGCSTKSSRLAQRYRDYDTEEDESGKPVYLCRFRKVCEYKRQFSNIEEKSIIICTINNVKRFTDYRNIIFDESYENAIKIEFDLTEEQILKYGIDIDLNSKQIVNVQGENFNFYDIKKEMDESGEIIYKNTIEPEDNDTYFMKKRFTDTDNLQCYEYIRRWKRNNIEQSCKCFHFFGINKYCMPTYYNKIIFSCGTTPMNIVYKITKTEHLQGYENKINEFGSVQQSGWQIYESKYFNVEKLNNKIVKSNHTWTKNFSGQYLDYLKDLISYIIKNKKSVLLVTKKEFKDQLFHFENMVDGYMRSVYFGMGRALNLGFKADYVIMFGRWGYTPMMKIMYNRLGFSDEMVISMEKSEMLQGLHRGRCIINNDQRIILMTDQHVMEHLNDEALSLITMIDLINKNVDIENLNTENSKILTGKSMNGSECAKMKKLYNFLNGM